MTNNAVSDKTAQFLQFLDDQLSQRGWTDYRLAKEARLSPSVISRTRSGKMPKWDACKKIAYALNLPMETVFRAADLLPASKEDAEKLAQFSHMYTQLTEDDRQDIYDLMQSRIRRRQKQKATAQHNKINS